MTDFGTRRCRHRRRKRYRAATARLLQSRGARVAVLDRSTDGAPDGVLTLRCDLTDSSAVDEAVTRLVDELGGLDIVVNNAGIGAVGDVADNDDAEWAHVLDVNVTGIARSPGPRCHTCVARRTPRWSTPVPQSPLSASGNVPSTAPARARSSRSLWPWLPTTPLRVSASTPWRPGPPTPLGRPAAQCCRRPGRRCRGAASAPAAGAPGRRRRGRTRDRLTRLPVSSVHHRHCAPSRRRHDQPAPLTATHLISEGILMLLGDVGSGNASCHSRALSAGSHRRLFSSNARFQCHLSARELQYAGRDKSQPDYRLSNQRHSKINCDCQTDRNCETPGYECALRCATSFTWPTTSARARPPRQLRRRRHVRPDPVRAPRLRRTADQIPGTVRDLLGQSPAGPHSM